MTSTVLNDDIRSIKTERALFAAMFTLLETLNFKKITVKGICEEAFISRAAFYTHFVDKYDLLKHWIIELCEKIFKSDQTYEQIEAAVNGQLQTNTRILKNLIDEADSETIQILSDYILSTKNMTVKKTSDRETYQKNVVVANFYAGGILNYILWQIKHKFPSDVPLVNKQIYDMINEFKVWKSRQS